MIINLLMKGIIIGSLAAIPIGPISILIIQNTLNKGKIAGITLGIGSASADVLHTLIIGLGLSFVAKNLYYYLIPLDVIGGIFLCYLGTRIFIVKYDWNIKTYDKKDIITTFFSSFFITFISPLSIFLYFSLLIQTNVLVYLKNYFYLSLLGLGVFIGAMIWWIILSNVVSVLKNRINHSKFKIINKISGFLLIGFGVYELISSLFSLISK